MFFKFKKFSLAALLGVFAFVTIAGSLVLVQPAHAQLPVTVTTDIPGTVGKIIDKTLTVLLEASTNLAMQSASYLMRRVAYDTAVWLASGGKGQTPFAQFKDFGTYMKDAADNAAGVAIEALGKEAGFNLCKIPDPKVDLAMRIGLTYKFLDLNPDLNTGPDARKPTCTWSSFQNDVLNLDNWQSQFGGADDIARKFNVAFSVDQTDVGILMSATQKVDQYVANQVEAQKLERQEGEGYIAKKTTISDEIVTPAKDVAKEAESVSPSEQEKTANQIFLAYLGTGFKSSAMSALSLFTNTLASQMLKNWKEKGMFPFVSCAGDLTGVECNTLQNTLNNLEGQVSRGGRQSAQALFSDLLTPPTVSVDQYNVLTNFTSCPSNPGPDNCVADTSLAQAAQEANSGKAITVAEALAKNWLHGEWKLISPDRVADNTDPTCAQRAYCYANIAKLRKARILPLGFELAALNSNPDKPWTLRQVVDGFNDCNFIRNASGVVVGVDNDPVNKPFCHLIDPQWVIKAPPSTCNVMAFGASPYFSGTPNRAQECVDMTTCVAYDKDGNCATQGYCTREKNVWKIDAAQCDSQYRTCKSFQDSSGKAVSYLYRTLDTGFCTQDTVGCAQYSLKQDSNGKWAGYSAADLNSGENSTIFFNNKASTNCSANSDGCSLFQVASAEDSLYLRKAPYYSGCYDTDSSTPAINWPRSTSDLNKLPNTTACNNYAQACIPDEVNCNLYEPISYGGEVIPGKFTPATIVENQIVWNDQCDKRCVGYGAYREMPSNYSNGQTLAYIIPSSGRSCSALEEGCASFTNLGTTNNGLEKVENYSYLRPCILPDETKQKTFFTQEGSVVGGFQLKNFVLEKDATGGPKYFYRADESSANYNTICNETVYRQGLASPDCRQFNDSQGQVYYRLLSKTIAVSNSCTPYRLNDTELQTVASTIDRCQAVKGKWDETSGTCQLCFQGGEYRDGQCFYYGLPGGVASTAGASQSCAASANTCRAYKGNAGNNVQNIFNNNFEQANISEALAGWSPTDNISQSLESTHQGEHSLSYNGTDAVVKNLSLEAGQSYDLTFWAKGSAGESITVVLENDTATTLGTVGVGDAWQNYHLGPVELGGTASTTKLKFQINGRLFLDNVQLKRVADFTYLVKNSLSIDSVCDSNTTDNLPGQALGCAQYRTPDNTPLYLTGFTSLCREKAIGCTALYDTQNSPDDPAPSAYNVWLAGNPGEQVNKTIGGQNYSCQVALGQSGCYVNVVGASLTTIIADGGIISTSTVYVQPDTPSSTPIYLVANRQASCAASDLGCTKAGRLTQTPTGPEYTDVLIKKDPASYKTTLCQSEAVGCNAYSSTEGALYFKDPQVLGQKVCAYRNDVTKNGVRYSGWFWKGVGTCTVNGSPSSQLCVSNNDCGSGQTCERKDEQPCYPTYLQSGNNYGLWSYGDTASYNNFVGECPAAQNGCTEFIDHNENNKTYYLLNDERLRSAQGQCNGQVSEKGGCILLDKTDMPNKFWNTAKSYAASASQNNNLVAPVADTATNDANIVLKVNRDRECGEWLQCRSSHRVFDAQLGTYKEVCDDIGRCDQALQSSTNGDLINCANWLDNTHELSEQVLTDDVYRNRTTDWKGQDFSGYSLLNNFPIEELSEVNFSNTSAQADWRLAKPLACGTGANCKFPNDSQSTACKDATTLGQSCGRIGIGKCVGITNPTCVQDLDALSSNLDRQSIPPSCRAYPEETSPFPNSEAVGKSLLFDSVNVCNETSGFTPDGAKSKSCECNYTKVSYGDIFTKYWSFANPNNTGILDKNNQLIKGLVPGICSGGEQADKACSSDADCTGGSCQKIKKQSSLIGWQGYCIEPDLSRPLNAEQTSFGCLTWFPKDSITGAFDINNQHVEAGFQASSAGGKYYCLAAKGNQQTQPVPTNFDYNKWLGTQTLSSVDAPSSGDDNDDRFKRTMQVSPNISVYQDEIDYIKIVATGDGNWFPNGNNTFYIRNGLITKYDGPSWSIVGKDFPVPNKLPDETMAPVNKYIYSDGTNKQHWEMRYDDGEGSGVGNFQYADPSGGAGLPFLDLLLSDDFTWTNTSDSDVRTCGSIDANGSDWYERNCKNSGSTISETDDGCAIKFSFKTTGELDKINFVCYTDNIDNSQDVTFRVYAGLRESCTYVAQTEENPYTSVGWTDRLWQNSRYIVGSSTLPTDLRYRFSLLGSPFGSLGISALDQDKLVNIYTHYDQTTFDPLPAVVGSPFSCGGLAPLKNCLDTTSTTISENVNGRASNKTVATGKDYLSEIFAKLNSVWVWSGSTYARNTTPQSTIAQDGRPYNLTGSLSDSTKAPKVYPLGTCKPGGKCLEGSVPGISINDKASGDILFTSNVALVNAKFYGFADKNQMPIRKIKLDWGDSSVVSLDGYFRNQRGTTSGVCGASRTCMVASNVAGIYDFNTQKPCASTSDCLSIDNCFAESQAPNFGQILGKTCDSAFFRFDHVYQCFRGGSGWTTSCPNAQTQSLYGGCCVFQPKVQLKDNWNWCNGTCGPVSGPGCYDGNEIIGGTNECETFGTAYTSSSVRVLVVPTD